MQCLLSKRLLVALCLVLLSFSFVLVSPSSVAFASTGSLTITKVWTRDGNGNDKTTFVPGEAIQYAVIVNNASGGPITGNFHFEAYWGNINDGVLQTVDYISRSFTFSTGDSYWYSPWKVPTDALPGAYTSRVIVNYQQTNTVGYGSFTVTGSKSLGVPYYSQFEVSNRNEECGPTSVAMLLKHYSRNLGGTKGEQISAIRNIIETYFPDGDTHDGTKGIELEAALTHFKTSFSEISQYIPSLNNPDAQITDIAAAIKRGYPVIAFINAKDLGRGYVGHWLVVTGFSSDGTNNYVLVNDPDSTFLANPDSKISLSPFSNAVFDGRGQEPNNIAGIIVTG